MLIVMRQAMARLERSATAPSTNLAAHWHSHDGHRMLVSTMVDSDVVVGCCRVMCGMDEKNPLRQDATCTACGVSRRWRMHEDEVWRWH
jgi:hypothetical protein